MKKKASAKLRKAGQAADDRRLARSCVVLCCAREELKALVAAHRHTTRKDEIGRNKDGRETYVLNDFRR